MKKLISTMCFALFVIYGATSQVNSNATYVNGYYKDNGTYVNGYYRTLPNNTINDNYSTYPNYNPYTGQQGTVQPVYDYQLPTYTPPVYYNTTPTYNNTPAYNYYQAPYPTYYNYFSK